MNDELHSGSTGDAMLRDTMLRNAMLRDAPSTTMRAAVCVRPGGPEVLEIRELPVPAGREGWRLVRGKGAGPNRAGVRTRQGHFPSVTFPRVVGVAGGGTGATSAHPPFPGGATVP